MLCFFASLTSGISSALSKQMNAPQIPQSMCLILTNIAIYGKPIMPVAGFHSNSFSESQTGFIILQFALALLVNL